MKRIFFILLSLPFFASSQSFTLVSQGKSNSRIVIPEKAGIVEIQAAKVLQDYIERMSGATLPIVGDEARPASGEVLIGRVKREGMENIPFDKLGKDGLFIKSAANRLIIAGGTGNGVLYGVYT
ncbi:MAG TPA: alpha-glucuronidase family glycosyl hydrolase, partial [Puia sp.]